MIGEVPAGDRPSSAASGAKAHVTGDPGDPYRAKCRTPNDKTAQALCAELDARVDEMVAASKK